MTEPTDIQASDLDHGEDAATDNFARIQQQQQQPKPPPSRPSGGGGDSKKSKSGNSKFKSLASRVLEHQQQQNPGRGSTSSGGVRRDSAALAVHALLSQQRRNRKTPSAAHAMLTYMTDSKSQRIGNRNNKDDASSDGDDDDEQQQQQRRRIVDHAMHGTTQGNESDMLYMSADLQPQDPNDPTADDTSTVVSDVSFGGEETLPLTGGGGGGGNGRGGETSNVAGYGSLAAGVRQSRVQRRKQRKLLRHLRRCFCDYVFNPAYWGQVIYQHVILHSLITSVALPCVVAAWILFYYLGNPTFDFLPEGRLSWWLNFVGRQVLLMELSRFSQWLLLDCFVLGTRFSVQCLGPLVTLTAIQAKGWPFWLAAWGMWDMMLLHGNNPFQLHWLYWTKLEIYNTQTGLHIISSQIYLRVLIAMTVAGLATTAKRAALAVYFGRRQLVEFKPRLEKLLGDIVLLSEVAALGEEADFVAQENETFEDTGGGNLSEGNNSGNNANNTNSKRSTVVDFKPAASNKAGLSSMVYTNVHFSGTGAAGESGGEGGEHAGPDDEPLVTKSSEDDAYSPEAVERVPSTRSDWLMSTSNKNAGESDLSRSSSGTINIKVLLDRWEEPHVKNDKNAQTSTIEEVLRFRRALACMDEEYPFGEAYGPADSRDACIQSANSLYRNLMKLDPTKDQLSFEMLALAIAEEEESEEYFMKRKAFRRLFRPDANGVLPLVAFVQSCDTVYRRLRYFIASVRNSSVIDKALEDMFNSFFFFVLTMLLMSVMRLNPWPMLVSVTSLLVSISFALGPSVSKYVEGVLLIAARRPYDLGDRIIITDSNSLTNPGVAESWFVEDINLWATTLRYARTNEVSTINNSAIAASRIVNCNRSPNAIVQFVFITNIAILNGTKIDEFREALERYVKENPRTWEAVAYVRHDEYDADWEKIFIRISVRHRSSWQDAARILQNRGQLHRFVFETGKTMGINFRTPTPGRVIYQGGDYQHPAAVSDEKALVDKQD
ncbi:hypothetical protein ACA910_011176 [Epithemia clementina (nom. ined.)]